MKGCRPLSRVQVKAVLKTTDSVREKALLTLGFATGFRISELLSLKVRDICTDGVIHTHVTVQAKNTKTKTGRTVFLNSDAKKALERLVQWLKDKGLDENSPLFLSRKQNHGFLAISRQQAHRLIKTLFAAVGELGNVATHTLRKTFAQSIYDATGGKLEKVQLALGHKSISSTISYLQIGTDDIEHAIAAMEF